MISDIFNLFEIKESKCLKCDNMTYDFHSFFTYELDILEAYKYKNNNAITLFDCLQYLSMIPKSPKLLCKKCGEFNQIPYISKIYFSSKILIFSLNRGDFDKDNLINVPYNIEEKIDLTYLVEEKECPKNYQLIGIVSITKEDNKLIYMSFCKSPIDKQWYLYNNEEVEQIDINEVIELHNNRNFIPCFLGYQALLNE